MTQLPIVQTPDLTSLAKGDVVATTTLTFTRDTLVRYAAASGDFNPIHYNDSFATQVGLESVIAHGMLTMGSVITPVVQWCGDPARITAYETRFTKPVPVPALGETALEVTATVGAVDAEAGTVRIDLAVTCNGTKVLTKSRATVALA